MVGYGYSAAKGALTNLVRQTAIDLARDGIRANGIAPGPIRTNIGGPGPIPEAIERKWSSTVLLGRMGWPHEIQGLAQPPRLGRIVVHDGSGHHLDGGGTSGYFATLPPVARQVP